MGGQAENKVTISGNVGSGPLRIERLGVSAPRVWLQSQETRAN